MRSLWEAALGQGEIPGAYWAVLTHRDVTADLRQKAFGEVHMLSHLVGAANRADIRRLVALESENAALRERAEQQQLRSQELLEDRDRTISLLRRELAEAAAEEATASRPGGDDPGRSGLGDLAAAMALVALQTERRERADQAACSAANEIARLQGELEHLGWHVQALGGELVAAEAQLRELCGQPDGTERSLDRQLRGRRVFYDGGRPSSTPAIRDLVLRHGGEFQHHDGGLEDRKGLLAAGVAWAHLVVFPVDCVDHDSATNVKRLCARQQVTYVPLHSASVASFAAGAASGGDSGQPGSPFCIRHG